MFQGSFVALITPFTKEGRVDEKKLTELVEWHISQGTNGLVPMGTTGESPTVSHEEHIRIIQVVVKAAKKRIPVIAGAGSNSTAEAIELSTDAKKAGVDAILSVNPYYNKPTQEGLFAHFSAISQAVDVKVVLYNIPSRSAVNLTPTTVEKLNKANPNIIGIKEASGSLDQAREIKERCGPHFLILSGDDANTLPLMQLGAKGVISVVANMVPKDVQKLCDLALKGKFAQAEELHQKLLPLVKALFIETNPAPIKSAMMDMGLIQNDSLRLPLVNVTPNTREKVMAAMKEYGVLIPGK